MTCPKCEAYASHVKNSRPEGGNLIMRRRECYSCGHRWTTYEVPYKLCKEAIDNIRHENGGGVDAT